MFDRREIVYSVVSRDKHPEHQEVNTRVSEYLRKYGQGKIDTLPVDKRPEINDERSVDEMLGDTDNITSSLGTEHLDALLEMQTKSEDFKKAFADIELTKKQKDEFDKAIKVLDNANASYEQKSDAYRILEKLEQQNKVKRTR